MTDTAHKLGAYTFAYQATELTIPEKIKTVAVVPTYKGSAVFQWEALTAGAEVKYFWDIMPVAQYNSLLALYLSMDTIEWDPKYLGKYQVIVTGFVGKYMEIGFNNQSFRTEVEMVLNIRSYTVNPI